MLPPGVSLGIIAFLLSLLPAGLFIWLWYLRRSDREVPASVVAMSFLAGMVLVLPAFRAENWLAGLWGWVSPATAHYFVGALLPLQSLRDVALPAVGTFLMVATVEEGLRYVFLLLWIKWRGAIDQVFDGLVVGIAAGLGFATVENTIYFLELFSQGRVDTLVFVFFLRFLVSTLAHISFGGVMGVFIARGVFDIYQPRRYLAAAFFLPWFLHGLYDLLLGINQSVYAVLMLLPVLGILVIWSGRKDFFVISRVGKRILVRQRPPVTREAQVLRAFLQQLDSPWNKFAPWLRERRARSHLLEQLEHDGHRG